MNTIEAIKTRKSIRKFTSDKISEQDLSLILEAGMAGPSCVNARDWIFIVVRDKDMLTKMADANGKPADPLRHADVGILVCGDLERAFPHAKDYWVIDASIATQNITLAAHDLGIGSVWLGTWPQMDRIEEQRKLFGLPETIIPHSILALGYPMDEQADIPVKSKLESDKIHYEKW